MPGRVKRDAVYRAVYWVGVRVGAVLGDKCFCKVRLLLQGIGRQKVLNLAHRHHGTCTHILHLVNADGTFAVGLFALAIC
jgi:hypothetical protein